ncbi:isochorismatase family protein [Streptomyces sp. PTM05]|uniref:Isochorismatase family protein n=1 Tax=Streptantibioticus parmotrematis TaxID=2873249 RepID=A0ABS7QQK5_9ACTN|nr:isochorismatase family protein [Streptantibioticus parmotrematis]MBY8885470.1 isochorismatase family protein [Streptantibioticus parmotrematis]
MTATTAPQGISVRSYAMPTPSLLPGSRAQWRVSPDRAALLVHDMQRYFLDFYDHTADPYRSLLANATALRAAAARHRMPVFYTAQPGAMAPGDRGLLADVWGPGMDATPEQRAITEELAPSADDTVLTKWRYSAFFRSDLLDRLRAAGRDQLVICGVYAHVGCLATAVEAFTHDIEVFLVGDAVADFGPDEHHIALWQAARTCAVVPPARAVLEALEDEPDALEEGGTP